MDETKEFTIRDRLGLLRFKGQMLAYFQYEPEKKPRWTDMVLYRITEPEESRRSTVAFEKALLREFSPEERDTLSDDILTRLAGILEDDQPVYRYALEIIARSYVYHQVPGPCVRGRHLIRTVGDARRANSTHRWRYLFPCTRCSPPDLEDMSDNQKYAEERDDVRTYLCTDASDIVAKLYKRNGEITEMASKLIRQAATKDPSIAKVLTDTRKV